MENKQQQEPRWLIFPVAFTMMRHDYSLIQIRVLVAVVERMQKILHDVLNNRRSPRRDLFAPDELDADGRLRLEFLLKDLGVGANHYAQLCSAMREMSSKPVEMPVKTADGRAYQLLPSLLQITISGEREYTRRAVVTMSADVARLVCSLQLGYQRLSRDVIFRCRNRYTPRVYMLVASWVSSGRVTIKAAELRRMLHLDTAYPKFSDFMRRVLRPARDEIRLMEQRGLCGCHFDVECRYDHGQRGGEPDELSFRITKTGADAADISDMQRTQLAQMLTRHFGFAPTNAPKVAAKVNSRNYQDVMSKLTMLYSRIATDHTIKDRAAYVYRSLEGIIDQPTAACAL